MPADAEAASGSPTLADLESRVAQYWDRTGVVARALVGAGSGPIFRFTEGPPTANGRPHTGHMLPGTLKDVQLRYRRMRGYRIVTPMAGWDCHGLGVEIEVEKKLGVRTRHDIEAYGIDRFCAECRASTLAVAAAWQEMYRRLGYWLDYEHAYQTMASPYIESVWWSLKTLFDGGLVEKGHYVLPYCPRCETTLSSHEVAQGYKETVDPSVTVRFPLRVSGGTPRDLLVWTTTPWTLTSNMFVVARADLVYVVVREDDGREVVLAEDAVPRYYAEPPEIVARLTGEELKGLAYEPPFSFVPDAPGRFHILLDDMVDAKEGTGFVHGAPSFGPDDYRIGEREKLGTFDPLSSRGVFTSEVPLVEHRFYKSADPILIEDLHRRGRLYRHTTLRHTYPFCWRCDTPLLYRAMDSWFVRSSRFSEAMVRNNASVTWVPAHVRDGRFGNFLTEAKDWALSRSRYWGTPLPVWVCPQGHPTCVGSFAELAALWGRPLPPQFDPHRVGVDPIEFPCPTCGQPSRREPYTIDVWYDSGSAPFAQYHYPFETGTFDPSSPLDYVAEGIDQTRGWFYTMHVLATALFGRPAYRAAVVTGMGLDDVGKKMSKSKGNAVDPIDLLGRIGGDAVRWYLLNLDFTEGIRMSESEMRSQAARSLGLLTNVATFYLQNARADRLAPTRGRPASTDLLDRWILSRLEGTRDRVTLSLESWDPRSGAAALKSFIDDLSTWYLRRSRPRFWADATTPGRAAAHATLGYVLSLLSRVLAPFSPHTAEWVTQELADRPWSDAETSVHLDRWPDPQPAMRDEKLEAGMDELRALVEVGRELRQRAGVRARIPLAEIVFFGAPSEKLEALGDEGATLLAAELNVRSVRWASEHRPDRFPEDAWVLRVDGDRTVAALPRTPTPELLEEGMVREVLRRLQQRRKELGLAFTDPIELALAAPAPLREALERRRAMLERELLAEVVDLVEELGTATAEDRTWEVDGVRFSARVARRTGRSTPTSPARPTPGARSPRRPTPRTVRRASQSAPRRPARARPSRTSRRGSSPRRAPPRRRPEVGGARSRRRPRRSVRGVRSRLRASAPQRSSPGRARAGSAGRPRRSAHRSRRRKRA